MSTKAGGTASVPLSPTGSTGRLGSQGSTPRSQNARSDNIAANDGNRNLLPEIRGAGRSLDRTKPVHPGLPHADFIPDDVLFALTQPSVSCDKPGPANRHRNLPITDSFAKKAPANVWNFPKRSERFSHLTKNTPCICGAGKDISFLYDIPKQDVSPLKPDDIDPSAPRMEEQQPQKQKMQLTESLIPDEYHMVKNKGVLGLEYRQDQFATKPNDHEKHLVLFPSMNPTSRYEVTRLKKALDDMLTKVGLDDIEEDMTGPTQMHNLLELIKKEQNIYNLVFHELIRQVSVECVDRGQLLSQLRDRYTLLINKIPKQIKGLHEEVLAQRAVDRRLTEQLMSFKRTISSLTSELAEVKSHDQTMSKQAKRVREELKDALLASERNASLVDEYHSLYELQRERLEYQVTTLSAEKEVWSSAAYCLALKVIEEHSLNVCKRLHVSEKSWLRLAQHFGILLSDKDTVSLTRLRKYVDKWQQLTGEFCLALQQRDETMSERLVSMKNDFYNWRQFFEANLLTDDYLMKQAPDKETLNRLFSDIKRWLEILRGENEKFVGDSMLTGQESLHQIHGQMDGWTDATVEVLSRHRGEDGTMHPSQTQLLNLSQEINKMLKQAKVRLIGESGVATLLTMVITGLEYWDGKVNSLVHNANPLPEDHWLGLYHGLDDWTGLLDQAQPLIGSSQSESDRAQKKPHKNIDSRELSEKVHKWISSTVHSIDSEDAKLVEQVTVLHGDMVRWMVDMLIHLAPDREGQSAESKEAVALQATSLSDLENAAFTLTDRLTTFTERVVRCCDEIAKAATQERLLLLEKPRSVKKSDDAGPDNENIDAETKLLKTFKSECKDWVQTVNVIMCELTGKDYSDTSLLRKTKSELEKEEREKLAEDEQTEDSLQDEEIDGTTEAGSVKDDQSETDSGRDGKVETGLVKEEKTEVSSVGDEKSEVGSVKGEKSVVCSVKDDKSEVGSVKGEKTEVGSVKTEPTEMEPGKSDSPKKEETDIKPESDGQMAADEEKEETEDAADEVVTLELIGRDGNTRILPLDEVGRDLSQQEGDLLPPNTPESRQTYESLAVLNKLQQELLTSEERAQTLEAQLEESALQLREEQAKVRELLRELGRKEEEPEEERKKEEEVKEEQVKPTTPPVVVTHAPTPTKSKPSKPSTKLSAKAASKGKKK